jgi:hypothetical protein
VTRTAITRTAAAGLLALAAAVAWAPAAHAGLSVAMMPAAQSVAPGATFDVTFQVSSGATFNAFTFRVGYDPAALTPVTISPSSGALGSLVTSACGTRFTDYYGGGGLDSADVSLLCPGVSMTGPGTVYRMRFTASPTAQVTTLRFLPGTKFVDAGVQVLGLTTHDAAIGIGTSVTLDAGDAPPPAPLALSVAPNPAHGDVAFAFGAPLAAPAMLRVSDVQGRTVRTLAVSAGARFAHWDGRVETGESASPGLYLVELRRGPRRDFARVAIVR